MHDHVTRPVVERRRVRTGVRSGPPITILSAIDDGAAEPGQCHVLERRVDQAGARVAERALEGTGEEAGTSGDPERLVGCGDGRARGDQLGERHVLGRGGHPGRVAPRHRLVPAPRDVEHDDPRRAQLRVQPPEPELDARHVCDRGRAVTRPPIERPASDLATGALPHSRGTSPRSRSRTRRPAPAPRGSGSVDSPPDEEASAGT